MIASLASLPGSIHNLPLLSIIRVVTDVDMNTPAHNAHLLADGYTQAERLQQQIQQAIIGQTEAIQLLTIAVFARGHVLLEGSVGVGKTTLLRAVARAVGGGYERIEGTIDLMPSDLIYYTSLNESGKPQVDPGPLLRHPQTLSVFFFNELNRARPQVHSLLLRVMAERSVSAFNKVFEFPHLQVFADRNRVEREETFELPAAARDRFLMEIPIEAPQTFEVLDELMFNPRFHQADRLIETIEPGQLDYQTLNPIAEAIQAHIHASPTLREYAQILCLATHRPQDYGIHLDGVEMAQLILSGISPRGMSYLVQAARVQAWLSGREMLLPEDLQRVFQAIVAHRIFLNPVYEFRHDELMPALIKQILHAIAAP